MKFIVAPDSFKENLTSIQVANFIEKGIKKADKNIIVKKIPVADGGEGTVETLLTSIGGNLVKKEVHGPLMNKVKSFFGILPDKNTAVIEMAAASGLNLISIEDRNPMLATTYGVGELILLSLEYGINKIIIGIGGSSTNDGGSGMAQALGIKFYDKDNKLLGHGGRILDKIHYIDISGIDKRLNDIEIIVACDVNNTMYGENGATYVFGPQKGCTKEMLQLLDNGLKNYCEKIQSQLDIDISIIPGSGAAGGLGGGLIAFTNANLKSGIDIIVEFSNFEKEIQTADLLIVGEGKTDAQTTFGKAPVGLAKIAKKYNVPVICLSGSLGDGYHKVYNYGIDSVFSCITGPMSLNTTLQNSGQMLEESAYSLTRLVKKLLEK